MKGKFKKDFNLKKDKLYRTDIVAVGDSVEYEINEDGSGVIDTIEDRKNFIARKAPKIKGAGVRGERLQQIIAANVDNFFIVTSIYEPDFNNKVVDRFLVVGESSNIKNYIIINKTDLDPEGMSEEWRALYEEAGYHVLTISVREEKGLEEIKQIAVGKKNLFWGQSGVGKSSILNTIYPELRLRTGEISSYHDKGIHTTVTSIMIMVGEKTYVIDTPGIREIDPFGIRKEDLGHYFREFSDYIEECRFNTCTHNHEPGCAVKKAAEEEKISGERYESYLRILETIEQDMNFT